MKTPRLLTYDPQWSEKYDAHHERLSGIWKRAVAEVREQGGLSRDTRAEYMGVIDDMRRTRMRGFETTGHLAERMFNVLRGKFALAGMEQATPPPAESFVTIAQLRSYIAAELEKLAKVRRQPKVAPSFALPNLARGEGAVFSGKDGADCFTQAVYLPDVEKGVACVVTTEKAGDARHICLASRKHPEKFEQLLPQLARALMDRLFKNDEFESCHFYVHYPLGYGRDGGEQFWKFDMRADAKGQFFVFGKQPLPILPYAIAHKQFLDGLPERETRALELHKAFDPYVDAWSDGLIGKQEKLTAAIRHKGYTLH